MASYGQSVTISYSAWNTALNQPQTGDSANHTLYLVKDGSVAAATNSPSEASSSHLPGIYNLALTVAEAQHNVVALGGISSTSNVLIQPFQTTFQLLPTQAIGTTSGLLTAGVNAGQINPVSGNVGIPANGIDMAQIAPDVRAATMRFYMVSTAITTPPTADYYAIDGIYNGISYLASSSQGLYAWFTSSNNWIISSAVGTPGSAYWLSSSGGNSTGPYVAQGTSSGAPLFTAHGNAVLASFQPESPFSFSTSGFVGSVTNPVTVGTNNDKSGYTLSSSQAFANSINSGLDWSNISNKTSSVALPNTTISSLQAVASVTNPVTVGTNNDKVGYSLSSSQSFANSINNGIDWSNISNKTSLVALTNTTISSLQVVASITNPVTVGTNNDKTGYSLSSSQTFSSTGNIGIDWHNVLNPSSSVALSNTTFSSSQTFTPVGTFNANVLQWNSANVSSSVAGIPDVNIRYVLQTLSAGAGGYMAPDWSAVHLPSSSVDLINTTFKGIDGVTFPSVVPSQSQITGGSYALSTSNGYIGLNWNAILNPSSSVNLSQTIIEGFSSSVTIGGNVTVGGYAAGQEPEARVWNALTSSYAFTNSFGQLVGGLPTYIGTIPTVVWSTSLPNGFTSYDAGGMLSGLNSRLSSSILFDPSGYVKSDIYAVQTGVVAADVWSAQVPSSYTAGEAGYILGHLAASADPWATILPNGYTGAQAGALVAEILNQTLSFGSLMPPFVLTNNFITGVGYQVVIGDDHLLVDNNALTFAFRRYDLSNAVLSSSLTGANAGISPQLSVVMPGQSGQTVAMQFPRSLTSSMVPGNTTFTIWAQLNDGSDVTLSRDGNIQAVSRI